MLRLDVPTWTVIVTGSVSTPASAGTIRYTGSCGARSLLKPPNDDYVPYIWCRHRVIAWFVLRHSLAAGWPLVDMFLL